MNNQGDLLFCLRNVAIVDMCQTDDAGNCGQSGVHRESYMIAHVLFNKRVGERDKMRGLPSIFFFFRNDINKFNNTGARMLDTIYHMTLELLKISFWCENVKLLPSFMQGYNGHCYVTLLICKTKVVYRFYCMT